MKPISFAHSNHVLGADQPEYLPLPVLRFDEGEVISCWKLNLWERLTLLFTSRLWFTQLTFGDPLQPQRPSVSRPFTPINK